MSYSQYQVAKEMTPAEVLIQQRLAYEALSVSTWATSTTPSNTPSKAPPPGEAEGTKVTGAVATKGKRKLSVREMVRTLRIIIMNCQGFRP